MYPALYVPQEIVALSGAHALGRCHTSRSGYDGPWTNSPITFSNLYFKVLVLPALALQCSVTSACRPLSHSGTTRVALCRRPAPPVPLLLCCCLTRHCGCLCSLPYFLS